MKKRLLAISIFLLGMTSLYSVVPDPANYTMVNGYELRNLWFQSYNLGNLSSNLCPVENNARSMAVLNGKVLICRRDGSEPYSLSIDVFDGTTGNFIRNQPLATNVFKDVNSAQVLYACNDIRVDDAGHVLVCNLAADNKVTPFQIWNINIEDGTGTKVLDYLKGGTTGSFRFESFDVYGDVTGNGYIISANGSGANVFRWEISGGVVASTPNYLAITSFYPTNATSPGVESRILAIDTKRFYLDGKNIFPTLYSYNDNLSTISPLSSFGDDITNKPTSTNRNGVDQFTINGRTFLSYANTDPSNATTPDPMKFKLIELGSNMSFLGSSNYFDYPGSNNGLYKKTSNRWLQTVYSEVNAAGTVATLYLYGPQYGLAAYKFGLTQHLDQLGAGDYRSVALTPTTMPVISATFSSGAISVINVTNGGSGFTDGAVVTIKGTTGGFAVFKADVVGGVITAVNVNSIVSGVNSGFAGTANVMVSGATNWNSCNWQVLGSDLITWTNTTNPPTAQNISIVPGHCVFATGPVTSRNLTVNGSLIVSGEINVNENLLIPPVSGGIKGYVKLGGSSSQIVSANGNVLDSLNVTNASGVTLSDNVNMKVLNVSAGAKLTNGGILTTTALRLNGNGSGTATFLDNGTTTATATVTQTLFAGRNWYISSPVSNAMSGVITNYSGNKLWSYDESTVNWTPITVADSLLKVMRGYVVNITASSPSVTFTGNLNNGVQTIQLTRNENGLSKRGFHLIGNPYPSYVNWVSATKNNLEPSMWYRTKNTNNAYVFDTYNATGLVGTNNNGYSAATRYIPPMQSFWVRVADGNTTGALTFNNTMRSLQDLNSENNILRAAQLNSRKLLRLEVSNGQNRDETVVYFSSLASDAYDSYDSPKITNENTAIPEIFTQAGNESLVINGLSDSESNAEIRLGFKTGESNRFSIKASDIDNFDVGTRIILVDKYKGSQYDLTDGSSYNFTSDITNSLNRFSIMVKPSNSLTLTEQVVGDTNTFSINVVRNRIIIELMGNTPVDGTVELFNILGSPISSTFISNKLMVLDIQAHSGVYLLRLKIAGQQTTRKILIEN